MIYIYLGIITAVSVAINIWLLFERRHLLKTAAHERLSLNDKIHYLTGLLENQERIELDREEYQRLEAKVIALNQAAQTLPASDNLEDQIDDVEQFFEMFKQKPPRIHEFCENLKESLEAQRRLSVMHKKIFAPLMQTIRDCEPSLNVEEQRLLLARMVDAAWMSYDMVETLADTDNMRKEQLLNVELLYETKEREQALAEATLMSTDSDSVPRWARVIRSVVVPLEIDKVHPVIYSGYKANIS